MNIFVIISIKTRRVLEIYKTLREAKEARTGKYKGKDFFIARGIEV